MMAAAQPTGHGLLEVGAGYLDIAAAIANPVRMSATALSPTLVVEDGVWHLEPTVDDEPDPDIPWYVDELSGDVFLWGDGALSGEVFLWGDGIITGDMFLWGDVFLWGDAAVHATNAYGDEPRQLQTGGRHRHTLVRPTSSE